MSDLPPWVEHFKWESDEQKKGFLAYLYWLKKNNPDAAVQPSDLFFIQKLHDTNEYWRESISQQVRMLVDEIRRLHEIIAQLKHGESHTDIRDQQPRA